MAEKILVITGPTATGKTALSVELAKKLGGEVVSADSMQIYRGMDIGTAKVTKAEMQGVAHHMIDIADPSEDYSVSRYVREADEAVRDILSRGKLPIVAGGTNLYIDSLIAGMTIQAARRCSNTFAALTPSGRQSSMRPTSAESCAQLRYTPSRARR